MALRQITGQFPLAGCGKMNHEVEQTRNSRRCHIVYGAEWDSLLMVDVILFSSIMTINFKKIGEEYSGTKKQT